MSAKGYLLNDKYIAEIKEKFLDFGIELDDDEAGIILRTAIDISSFAPPNDIETTIDLLRDFVRVNQ